MPPFGDTVEHKVKTMATGDQVEADYKDWKAADA